MLSQHNIRPLFPTIRCRHTYTSGYARDKIPQSIKSNLQTNFFPRPKAVKHVATRVQLHCNVLSLSLSLSLSKYHRITLTAKPSDGRKQEPTSDIRLTLKVKGRSTLLHDFTFTILHDLCIHGRNM